MEDIARCKGLSWNHSLLAPSILYNILALEKAQDALHQCYLSQVAVIYTGCLMIFG